MLTPQDIITIIHSCSSISDKITDVYAASHALPDSISAKIHDILFDATLENSTCLTQIGDFIKTLA